MSKLFLLLSAAQLQTRTKSTSLVSNRIEPKSVLWSLQRCLPDQEIQIINLAADITDGSIALDIFNIYLALLINFSLLRWSLKISTMFYFRNILGCCSCPCWWWGLCPREGGGARGRATAWRGERSVPSSGSGGGAAATGMSARRSAQRRRTARPPTNTSARNTRNR